LPSIVASYRRMLNQAKDRVEATVRASSSLQARVLERLRAALRQISGKDIVLHEATDPSLIGGLVVELEGRVYDGSIKNQLEQMKQRIAREF
jgi:F-type H+-transporting ATPase subunit delta